MFKFNAVDVKDSIISCALGETTLAGERTSTLALRRGDVPTYKPLLPVMLHYGQNM
jgi:hypothetical protein